MSAKFKRGDRVAGTINGHAFTALVTGVKYVRGQVFYKLLFDGTVDVLNGHVREHMVTTGTVPDLRLVTHKSTYFTTGRPRSHWRKCSCGWSTSGMMSAKVARELFEQHVAEVTA